MGIVLQEKEEDLRKTSGSGEKKLFCCKKKKEKTGTPQIRQGVSLVKYWSSLGGPNDAQANRGKV